MSHNRKSKDKGLGSNSVFDLKAIVALEEQKLKAVGNKNKTTEMELKKSTRWGGQNKGVQERNARDLAQDDIDRPSLESIQAIMDRKTKQYKQLKKGKTGGLTPAQIAELPLEFFDSNSASEDDDDSDPLDPNEEQVEYTDDLGRTRTVPRSQVPRHFLEKKEEVKEDDILREGNLNAHYPIYEPTAEKVQKIHAEFDESNNPLQKHYIHQGENRQRGAAGYNFSSDEAVRQQQQQDLKDMRMATKDNRAESGAIDLKPGESEGFDHSSGTILKGSMKRRRELEERRKELAAKRKKSNKEEQPCADTRKETSTPTATEIFMATAGPSTSKLEHGLKAKTTPADLADAFLADMEQSGVLKRTGQ